MRLALALAAVLAASAQRGCDAKPTSGGPPETTPPCQGRSCGDACVVDPPCLPAGCLAPSQLGRCDDAEQCVPLPEPVLCVGDPACAGKPCGEACDPCGGLCMHPYASGCDRAGRCVPWSPYLCDDPCAGLACGDTCHLCPPAAPDCVEVALALACDREGLCVPAPATCP